MMISASRNLLPQNSYKSDPEFHRGPSMVFSAYLFRKPHVVVLLSDFLLLIEGELILVPWVNRSF
jgi:hypothetical protein